MFSFQKNPLLSPSSGAHSPDAGGQGGGAPLLRPGEGEAPAGDRRAQVHEEADRRGSQQHDPGRQDESRRPAGGAPAAPGADLQDQVGLREGHPQTGTHSHNICLARAQ